VKERDCKMLVTGRRRGVVDRRVMRSIKSRDEVDLVESLQSSACHPDSRVCPHWTTTADDSIFTAGEDRIRR
jgi:hypothetical protein